MSWDSIVSFDKMIHADMDIRVRPWHSVAYTASRASSILVEKMLDPARYKKWNSNNGWTDGMRAGEHLAAGPVRYPYCSPRHPT